MAMTGATVDRSRRALLRGRRHAESPMRPPWALVEARFLEACTRCGDCVSACPEGILAKGDGGFAERRPDAGECNFCGDCLRSCDAGALHDDGAPAWAWQAAIGESCLTAGGVVCQSCREACPELAIAFPPNRGVAQPQLDGDRCNACGACLAVCPPGAIALVARGAAA
jgi:ferredoxin-type protein NapF